MTQIEKCVEDLKLTYLSHIPIAWIVCNDIEIAHEIIDTFAKEHGLFDNIDELPQEWEPGPLQEKIVFSYDWVSPSSDPKENQKLILKISNCICNITKLSDNAPLSHLILEGGTSTNFMIFASPQPPHLGWLNNYIHTIYVEGLEDTEIENILLQFTHSNNIPLDDNLMEQLIVNFRGISSREIRQVMSRCVSAEYFDEYDSSEKILNEVRALKRQKLEGFPGLKWVKPSNDTTPATGLGAIQTWLDEHKDIFSDPQKMQKKGYDTCKGILVTGIPGTGKSLIAKESARILNLPLIQMDLGDLQEGIVGKSEEHMANALRMIDTMSPCILWIDEIEKAFAGSNSGSGDSGVMRRMFGKFLTWMQEKKSFCFVFATSNDITQLPPELFRSERFDIKFYNFMPNAEECSAIFAANIRHHNKQFRKYNGGAATLFDGKLEKEEFWINFLNRLCFEDVRLNEHGVWENGCTPQKKLFTGADIAAFVKLLKFKILRGRISISSPIYNRTGAISLDEVNKIIPLIISDFMPYGQTNLYDIAKCFFSLHKNQFCSASDSTECIIDFSKFDEYGNSGQFLRYDPERFNDEGQAYNRTLYRTIVGAINTLAHRDHKFNPKTMSQNEN